MHTLLYDLSEKCIELVSNRVSLNTRLDSPPGMWNWNTRLVGLEYGTGLLVELEQCIGSRINISIISWL